MKASNTFRQASQPGRSEPAAHLYTVGQEVRLKAGSVRWFQTAGIYRITATLPLSGAMPQYRIRSDDEPHERVVTQDQLETVDDPGAGADASLIERTFGQG